MSRLRDGGGGGSSGSHCASVCLYSPSIAGQLWHFRVTAAGTSGKSSARNRGVGAEQKQLVFWEEGKETLVVVKSWSSTHRLRWEQGSEIPPKAAEGLNQPRSWGDIALGSWVLVCWSHTVLPVWDPPGSPSQALEVGAGQPSPLSCLQTLPTRESRQSTSTLHVGFKTQAWACWEGETLPAGCKCQGSPGFSRKE